MFQNYIKTAFRTLSRNKVYAVMNIVGLGLGMGCALLIFILVSYHFSFDAFHKNADNTYRVATNLHFEELIKNSGVPNPFAAAFRADFPVIKTVSGTFSQRNPTVSIEKNGRQEILQGQEGFRFVEPSYFDIFDAKFISGTSSVLEDPYKAILTKKTAEHFFGSTDIIGKTMLYDQQYEVQIEGLIEDIPSNTDFMSGMYVSYTTFLKEAGERAQSWKGITGMHQVFLVLPDGVKPETINANLKQFAIKQNPENGDKYEYFLQPIKGLHFNTDYGGFAPFELMIVLSLVCLFILGIACINFINLATAQAINRSKEVGVRKVIGGSKKQIVSQFFIETLVLVSFGMLLAMSVAFALTPSLASITDSALSFNPIANPSLALLLFLAVILITFLAGFYPALVLSGFKPVKALKGRITTQSLRGFNLRRALVVTQFAVCQLLIIALLVISKQMDFIKNIDLGFKTEGIVSVDLPENSKEAVQAIEHELSKIPAVKKLSSHWTPPASQNYNTTNVTLEGKTEPESWQMATKAADHQYIELFEMELVAGKNMIPTDTIDQYIINESAVKKCGFTSNEAAIGKRITIWDVEAPIVGVVKDFHSRSVVQAIESTVIMPERESYYSVSLLIDLENTPRTLAQIEETWKGQFPDHYFSYSFFDEDIASFYQGEHILLKLIRFFCGIAIFIACMGLYGLVSFMASRKQKEIGVRKVLGASLSQILSIFGKEFLTLMALGFLIAAPLAYLAMNGWLNIYIYRISLGIGIFLTAILLTTLLTFVTIGWQSGKAALQHPSEALGSE